MSTLTPDRCDHCGEPFDPGDDPPMVLPLLGDPRRTQLSFHPECNARRMLGSVGHQLKRCRCFGGTEDEPEGLTKREAARLAVVTFERLQREQRGSMR